MFLCYNCFITTRSYYANISNYAYLQHITRVYCAGGKPMSFKRFVQMVWEISQTNIEKK